MTDARVAAVARDPRLLGLAAGILGGRAEPYRATLFAKSGRANWLVAWHQDVVLPLAARVATPEWGPWSIKSGRLYARAPAWALSRCVALRVHLDASTSDNGALRVVPNSHRLGVLSAAAVAAGERRQPTVVCSARPGDVLAMYPLLVHASSKATVDRPRRVLHIEYADCLEVAPGVRLALA